MIREIAVDREVVKEVMPQKSALSCVRYSVKKKIFVVNIIATAVFPMINSIVFRDYVEI